jgi:phosphoglycolate phosphatase
MTWLSGYIKNASGDKFMKYKYILMDMDGMICDSARGILTSLKYSLDSLGIKTPDIETLRPFLGPPIRVSYNKLFNLEGERLELAVAKYREHYIPTGMFINDLYPGIAKLIQDLKADGRIIMLATGKVHDQAEQILAHFDLLKYFDFVAGCELDGTRSYKHEIINYALENISAQPVGDAVLSVPQMKKSAVMIGDRYHDIAGAAKAGVASIGVLYGYGTREELEEHKPDYLAENVEELRELLF